MSHYTQAQATELITQAHHQEGGGYRFGQALWNLMHNNITRSMTATEADFFYDKDDKVVITLFYKNFVIGGDV
jgi:hypothetical protein